VAEEKSQIELVGSVEILLVYPSDEGFCGPFLIKPDELCG
jgi:hypothetical protein